MRCRSQTPAAHFAFKLKFCAISSTAVVFFLSGSEMRAQSESDTVVSFDRFLSSTAAAVYNSTTMPKVANAAAFEEMRQHIVKINEGMQVTHSFAVGSQTYDCMAIESQPAIRLLDLKSVATPPAHIAPLSGATGGHTSVLPAWRRSTTSMPSAITRTRTCRSTARWLVPTWFATAISRPFCDPHFPTACFCGPRKPIGSATPFRSRACPPFSTA